MTKMESDAETALAFIVKAADAIKARKPKASRERHEGYDELDKLMFAEADLGDAAKRVMAALKRIRESEKLRRE